MCFSRIFLVFDMHFVGIAYLQLHTQFTNTRNAHPPPPPPTSQHPMVCEDALAALELLAAASVPYRIVLYEAGAVEATGKLLLTSKGYEAGAVEATGKLVTGAKGTSEGGHTSEGWRTPHIAAWLLCRLAQLSHDAQAAVINTGVCGVCVCVCGCVWMWVGGGV